MLPGVIIELFDIQPCGTSTLLVGKCRSNKSASCRHHNGVHPQSRHKSHLIGTAFDFQAFHVLFVSKKSLPRNKSGGLRCRKQGVKDVQFVVRKCQGTGNASIGVGTPQCIVPIRALLWPIWGSCTASGKNKCLVQTTAILQSLAHKDCPSMVTFITFLLWPQGVKKTNVLLKAKQQMRPTPPKQ